MATFYQSTVRFSVPVSKYHALKERLMGPNQYIVPAYEDLLGAGSFTAHQQVEFAAQDQKLIRQQVADAYAPSGFPADLPIGLATFQRIQSERFQAPKHVPFSIPAINPLTKEECKYAASQGRNAAEYAEAIYLKKLGVDSILFDVEDLERDETIEGLRDHDIVEIAFAFATKSGTITTFGDYILPVLEQYQARMAYIYVTETSYNYEVYDPEAEETIYRHEFQIPADRLTEETEDGEVFTNEPEIQDAEQYFFDSYDWLPPL